MRSLAVFVLFCTVLPTRAEDPVPIRIILHPAPPSASALKYRLLPELRDMQTGNAVVHYLRALSPEVSNMTGRQDAQEKADKILETPLAQLKGTTTAGIVNPVGLTMLQDGSRCTYNDWEMLYRARREGYMLLLPEVQAMRGLARQLAVRTRVSLAEGKFDDAHRDLCTNLAMGRHVADSITLIQGLVGIAMTGMSLNQVEAWIGQPNAPSLYWPLTDLPTPFIDLRRAFEGERFLLEAAIPGYHNAQPGHFHLDRDKFIALMSGVAGESSKTGAWPTLAYTLASYPAAKAYLKTRGWTESQIDAMSALSAVVLQQAWEYDRMFDDYIKVLNLPPKEALLGFDRVEQQIQPSIDRPTGQVLAGLLLPSVKKVYVARIRTDRRIAALRTIEAIRLHLTEKGSLPARLEDITAVPVPTDIVTGKPFEYRRDGATARLIVVPLAGPNTPKRTEYVNTSAVYVLTAGK